MADFINALKAAHNREEEEPRRSAKSNQEPARSSRPLDLQQRGRGRGGGGRGGRGMSE